MSVANDLKELLSGTAEIKPEDVHFDPRRDLIGGGAFGYVYRGLFQQLIRTDHHKQNETTHSRTKILLHSHMKHSRTERNSSCSEDTKEARVGHGGPEADTG